MRPLFVTLVYSLSLQDQIISFVYLLRKSSCTHVNWSYQSQKTPVKDAMWWNCIHCLTIKRLNTLQTISFWANSFIIIILIVYYCHISWHVNGQDKTSLATRTNLTSELNLEVIKTVDVNCTADNGFGVDSKIATITALCK